MRRRVPECTVLGIVPVALTPFSAHGQTAREVIGRHVEAIGGDATLDRIQTIRYDRILTHIEDYRSSSIPVADSLFLPPRPHDRKPLDPTGDP